MHLCRCFLSIMLQGSPEMHASFWLELNGLIFVVVVVVVVAMGRYIFFSLCNWLTFSFWKYSAIQIYLHCLTVTDSSTPQMFQILNAFCGIFFPFPSLSISPPPELYADALLRTLRLCAFPDPFQVLD